MKYLFASIFFLLFALSILTCLPALWSEKELFKELKQDFFASEECPSLKNGRLKVQQVERSFLKAMRLEKKYFSLSGLLRIHPNDIIVQKLINNCTLGYVVELRLQPLFLFSYTIHSVRKISK
jgi:hypothetical protein